MQPQPLNASPLHLESYYIQALRFETKPEFDREGVSFFPEPSDLGWELEHTSTEEGALALRLTLELAPDKARYAYAFEVVVVGTFRVSQDYEGDARQLEDANAPAVLFGMAREAVAASTGRGPFPPLCLPTVHFLGLSRAEKPSENDAADEPELEGKGRTTSFDDD